MRSTAFLFIGSILFFYSCAMRPSSSPTPEHSGSFYIEGQEIYWEQEADHEAQMRELYLDLGMISKFDIFGYDMGYHLGLFHSSRRFDLGLERHFFAAPARGFNYFRFRALDSDRWEGRASLGGSLNWVFLERRLQHISNICIQCEDVASNQLRKPIGSDDEYYVYKRSQPLLRMGFRMDYSMQQYGIEFDELNADRSIRAATGEIIVPGANLYFNGFFPDSYTNVRTHIISIGIDASAKQYLRFRASHRKHAFGEANFFQLYAQLLVAAAVEASPVEIARGYEIMDEDRRVVQAVAPGVYSIQHDHADALELNRFGAKLGLCWRRQSPAQGGFGKNFGSTLKLEMGFAPQVRGLFPAPQDQLFVQASLQFHLNVHTSDKQFRPFFVEEE